MLYPFYNVNGKKSFLFCVVYFNYHILQFLTICSVMMNDRRGHRKLRLTSRKHFKAKPKRVCKSIPAQELQPPNYQISLPLQAYTDAPVKCLNNLLNRLKTCEATPSGMRNHNFITQLYVLFICVFWYRMDE